VPEEPYPSRAQAEAAFERHVSPGKLETYRRYGFELAIGARSGPRIHDAYSDRWWFNCHSNGGVFNLGHRHPAIVSRLIDALQTLDIGNHHLVSPWRARLAERLAATTGGALPGVVFAVAGGEAVDLAIKVCRGVTGRPQVVSALGGYHGHTGLALATGDPSYREPFGANLPGFSQVPFADLAAIDAAVGDQTAAVILEAIPATLGMPIAPPEYFPGVERICRQRGAKLIIDEVQTGLGRTGRIWGYDHEAIRPDALITGKGLSGGVYPISATLLSAELHAFFLPRPFVHISTFGGAELGCAVALAVLDQIEAPGFLERVAALSERFAAGLVGLPFELRRRGLMMGLKFPAEGAGLMAAKMLFDQGVFAVYANNDTSVLQFLPPLILEDGDADEIIRRVRRTFS
jgi:acetylornithine/succinyldiaminopimelate/putrescine aminotransferase